MTIQAVRPPRPISKDPPRPSTAATTMTASTRRLTFSQLDMKRPIKYGIWKGVEIELIPQPSNDSEDPFNWPLWRRNLSFFSLLYMVSIVGVSRTMFVTVNSDIAMNNGVSYTAAVSLTAVPLMVSAVSGLMSNVGARVYGKRPIYLASTISMFVGSMWGMYVMNSFSQNMASRVFQGIGWGAFDTLVLGSLQDTFFQHELDNRVAALNVVSVASTWGAPLLGGVTSSGPRGFCLQYEVLSILLALGIWIVVFGVPESTFDRTSISTNHPNFLQSRPRLNWPWIRFSKEAVKDYITRMKPWTYKVSKISRPLILQAPRAMLAPTNMLLFTVTLLPHVALWGYTSSLSLLFSVLPFSLSSRSIGVLFTGPFIFATILIVVLSIPLYSKRFTTSVHWTTLAVGAVTASIGIFGFGLYIEGSMTMSDGGSVNKPSNIWKLDAVGSKLNFPVVSFLLGILAAGSVALDATIRPMIQRSTAFTSVNLSVSMRNTADMHAGLTCLRNMVAGTFILGIPNAIWAWDGLRSAALGVGITQFFIAGVVGCVWWQWEETVRRLDGKTIGSIGISDPELDKSFFDTS
ncbi:major facilitator superfamily domain-containing protein [Truncatella angustata]|uniref:Major facilitator superfamily domain-containing protein n=1 Tax=Truncatella angustata TaxID=152316 RepID=A0A9P8UVX5_9PEZI|nr:major facilitator superfamily domain-containing protein [Truncatella angustata]KAH6659320.1 major facilitator superfamily domain-containing protein [Truncatella angustata]